MLVKTSKTNVFQVTILVLLLAVIGVVYQVYSHGSAINPYYNSCPVTHSQIKSRTSNYDCTKYLQWSLGQLGKGLTVDGPFGPAITTAVKNFQTSKGLYPDGIVGSNTWAALDKAVPPNLASVGLSVNGLPSGSTVQFHALSSLGSFGTIVYVTVAKFPKCMSTSSISTTVTYPKSVYINGRTYNAYQTCGGISSITSVGGVGGCGGTTTGSFTLSDSPADDTGHITGISYLLSRLPKKNPPQGGFFD